MGCCIRSVYDASWGGLSLCKNRRPESSLVFMFQRSHYVSIEMSPHWSFLHTQLSLRSVQYMYRHLVEPLLLSGVEFWQRACHIFLSCAHDWAHGLPSWEYVDGNHRVPSWVCHYFHLLVAGSFLSSTLFGLSWPTRFLPTLMLLGFPRARESFHFYAPTSGHRRGGSPSNRARTQLADTQLTRNHLFSKAKSKSKPDRLNDNIYIYIPQANSYRWMAGNWRI
jgi:hypothetical protein